MGVTGLWRLIEPAGKPVPVETLENKVLAVDISIWLHQMVKGYQDAKGAPLPNAHLIGLFQRLCKLLYFRIKPVFVFDGVFPELKKETIAKRQDNKLKYNSESARLKRELALLLSKKTAINSLLGKQISPKKISNPGDADDLFKLPALPQEIEESESESEDEQNSSGSIIDLHSVDVESDSFKKLPLKEKYDLLIELKETRKMNSWGKLHELPKKSDNFSNYQMQRLLKRRKVQEVLQETEKEMGGDGMSLNELESLLNDEGIETKIEELPSHRIASNDTTRYLFINNVKQALAEARKKKGTEHETNFEFIEKGVDSPDTINNTKSKKDELQDDIEKAIKMSLETANDAETSGCVSKTDESWTSYVTDTDYSTDSEEDCYEPPDMSSAKAYIMQYSDFTNRAIDEIVTKKSKGNNFKSKKPRVFEIIEQINKEKSVITDNVEISSSDVDDDDCVLKSSTHNLAQKFECANTNKSDESHSLSVNHMDATQASVICVENAADVVLLNSSTDESLNKPILADSSSSSETTKEIRQNKNEESNSSDEDFEDVPEIEENKTVVQLTLNVNDVLDDDIFADIFNKNPEPDISSSFHKQVIPKSEPIDIVIDEEDDELQKAIKMSLECVNEDEISKLDVNSEIINQEPLNDASSKPSTKASEETNKIQSSISIIQQSLDIIQSAQTSRSFDSEEKSKSNSKETDCYKEPISREDLNNMVEQIQTEEQDLIQEKGRLDRVGRNISEEMTKEAQELLRLFGIPYIVAPMEAEAQCAFLESIKLTDGTITDDSDIWLFGGRTVYKNFFNQKKHVLQFLADRIEKSFNLSREQLVLLALLVGSDYTTGVAGVGPVTALEILASFPFNKRKLLEETAKQTRYIEIIAGLQQFKQWVRSGKRTDNTSLKRKLKNVTLTEDFPSVRVVQAYLEPNVEKSEDKFTWGELDITILRDYTKDKFGWSQHKLDEIIKPVLKRMVEKKNQKTVQDYFKRKVQFESLEEQMSKRVKAAVQRMGPEETAAEITVEKEKPEWKRKPNKGKSEKSKAGPSNPKQKKTDDEVLIKQNVKIVSDTNEGKSKIEIMIPKTDRYQEIIPQREKEKQSLLQNKMKAIEVFRKNNIDRRKKTTKRKQIAPKAEAELSESDSN